MGKRVWQSVPNVVNLFVKTTASFLVEKFSANIVITIFHIRIRAFWKTDSGICMGRIIYILPISIRNLKELRE